MQINPSLVRAMLSSCLVLQGVAKAATPAPTHEPSASNASADLLVKVKQVQEELELLRYAMGKPHSTPAVIEVTGAAPREAFYQAIAMLHNANRLCFEHTREIDDPFQLPEGEIDDADVVSVVDAFIGLYIGSYSSFFK